MSPEIFLWIFIALVLFEYFFSTILDYINDKNWKDEIPIQPNNWVGKKTRWKKGESGRKNNSTLSDDTLKRELLPNE